MMEIRQPTWTLRTSYEVCECKAGACLLFVTCESCKGVFLHCHEGGFVYLVRVHRKQEQNDRCPSCGQECIYGEKVRPSTAAEIQSNGYGPEEYE